MLHQYKIYETQTELAHELAHQLKAITNIKPEVYIAISGGNTPRYLFDILAKEYAETIEWERINFFWVDERCVPPTDSESNYGMTLKHLLSALPITRHKVYRIKGEMVAKEALEEYIEQINNHVPQRDGLPCFDLTLLGMGEDGHTASIFPHEIELWQSPNICAIGTHKSTGQQRITLTGKTINNSSAIVLMITGENKAPIIKEIFNQEASSKKYPASLVDTSKSEWWLDKKAAELIKQTGEG